jgi:hypothetical protein
LTASRERGLLEADLPLEDDLPEHQTRDPQDHLRSRYGTLESGILELGATFRTTIPGPARLPAEMRVVCNVGPGALLTGEHEGVFIHVAEFEFEPLEPELGLTIFVPAPG